MPRSDLLVTPWNPTALSGGWKLTIFERILYKHGKCSKLHWSIDLYSGNAVSLWEKKMEYSSISDIFFFNYTKWSWQMCTQMRIIERNTIAQGNIVPNPTIGQTRYNTIFLGDFQRTFIAKKTVSLREWYSSHLKSMLENALFAIDWTKHYRIQRLTASSDVTTDG